MRLSALRDPFALAVLPALSMAIALAATPARASPDSPEQSRAERQTDDDAELLILAGLRSTLVSQIEAGGESRAMEGVGLLYGERHGGWLTTELRADVLWDEAAMSGGVQAALMYDAGGLWSPVVGAWMGYRGSVVEFGADGQTTAHDALLGLELGGRLRVGPFTGELTGQAATATLSSRRTRGVEPMAAARPLDFGELAELSLAVRVGLTF